MGPKFTDLGIPFPLFEAPVKQASEYVGAGTCWLCGMQHPHCFRLSIGADVIVPCPACATENALDADDKVDGTCRTCKAKVPFPKKRDGEAKACYSCLRSGRAALTKDTQLGMIRWEETLCGVTHGVPGLNHSDFEMVPKEDDWVGARLPAPMMFELLRTPSYSTIQGERWQFCCRRPMIFIGEWSRDDFFRNALDGDGRKLFDQIVQEPVPALWEDELHDITGIYVFRCPECRCLTAHWDVA